MNDFAVLVGNDINNLNNSKSWENLLRDIIDFCDANDLITNFNNKPFPLLYEEIFLKSIRRNNIDEIKLKKFIANKVSQINGNDIHKSIRNLDTKNIITTNYDFTLEGFIPSINNGLVKERTYSIFRNIKYNGKTYWHIHGDSNTPASINLRFEHYGGQLQHIRNYIVSGTNYKNKKVKNEPLIKRLKKSDFNLQSWIDLFFTTDIFIFALNLDFVETDLWWLLTYRARYTFYKGKSLNNKIFYFIPTEYLENSKSKIDLLEANGVDVVDFSGKDRLKYYNEIIKFVAHNKTLNTEFATRGMISASEKISAK